jgi:hypothetical protein
MKFIKKIRNKFIYLFVYIALRRQGFNKKLAEVMAENYINFKYE